MKKEVREKIDDERIFSSFSKGPKSCGVHFLCKVVHIPHLIPFGLAYLMSRRCTRSEWGKWFVSDNKWEIPSNNASGTNTHETTPSVASPSSRQWSGWNKRWTYGSPLTQHLASKARDSTACLEISACPTPRQVPYCVQ
jgi:hypothetical protein